VKGPVKHWRKFGFLYNIFLCPDSLTAFTFVTLRSRAADSLFNTTPHNKNARFKPPNYIKPWQKTRSTRLGCYQNSPNLQNSEKIPVQGRKPPSSNTHTLTRSGDHSPLSPSLGDHQCCRRKCVNLPQQWSTEKPIQKIRRYWKISFYLLVHCTCWVHCTC
jgi:hypothetical protein